MGTIRVLGDFAELERKLADGIITQDEYQKIFEKTRINGFDGSIRPFAVGGSDSPIIMGHSPYKTPLGLYNEKFGLIKKTKPTKDDEWTFFRGHVFEGAVRDIFAKKTGLKTQPCTLQIVNSDYPHLVANIDGLVWEENEPGIYEGKTTYPWTTTKVDFESGEVPFYYWIQCQFYMEIWNVNFAYINCAWGLHPENDIKHIRIPRDREYGREICLACEQFVLNAIQGIKPDNSIVQNLKALARDSEILYGKADSSLPPVEIPSNYHASFKQLDRLAKEKDDLELLMKPFKEQIKEIEAELKPYQKKLKSLEKEETEILAVFTNIIKNSTKGVFRDNNAVYTVNYNPAEGYSLDAEVKDYWKSHYPDCFDDVTSYKPKLDRQLSYTKEQAN